MFVHRDTYISWTQELRRRDLVPTGLQGVWHQESFALGAEKWLHTPALELQEPRWHLLLGYWLMSLTSGRPQLPTLSFLHVLQYLTWQGLGDRHLAKSD